MTLYRVRSALNDTSVLLRFQSRQALQRVQELQPTPEDQEPLGCVRAQGAQAEQGRDRARAFIII